MSLPPWQRKLLRSAPASALFAGLRWWHRRCLLVLTYHSVVDVDEAARRRYAPLYRNAVSAERFERQMRFLKEHYHVAGPERLRAFLHGDALPEPSVLLTFDDGLLNNYTVAWPILKRLGLPAFFFLPTAFLGAASAGELRWHWSEEVTARLLSSAPAEERRQAVAEVMPPLSLPPDLSLEAVAARAVTALKALPEARRRSRVEALRERLREGLDPSAVPADREGRSLLATMTWKQAREMAAEGAAMGAHGVSHAILSRLPEAEARTEIHESVARVAEQVDRCEFFAYPNGTAADFTPAHERALADAGCQAAFTQIRGFNDPAPRRPMALRRIDVSPNHPLGAFQYVSSGAKRLVDRWARKG